LRDGLGRAVDHVKRDVRLAVRTATKGLEIMSETPHKKQDFLEVAKHQFAQISTEFEKALEALKDPDRRKQLTSSYLEMLQKGLSRAQESVTKYQEKVASHPTAATQDEGSVSDTSATAEPKAESPEAPTS
jgi:chromosome condensin MukBEF ATPase and DNA-binding subunit MukB